MVIIKCYYFAYHVLKIVVAQKLAGLRFFRLPRDMMTKEKLVKFARKLYRVFVVRFFNVRGAAFLTDRSVK